MPPAPLKAPTHNAQHWRSALVREIAAQRDPHLFQILQQRAALRAMLQVPLDAGTRYGIELMVEKCLHSKGFSALHAALLGLAATSGS
jgi:hypothetical protein